MFNCTYCPRTFRLSVGRSIHVTKKHVGKKCLRPQSPSIQVWTAVNDALAPNPIHGNELVILDHASSPFYAPSDAPDNPAEVSCQADESIPTQNAIDTHHPQISSDVTEIDDKLRLFQYDMRKEAEEDLRFLKATNEYALGAMDAHMSRQLEALRTDIQRKESEVSAATRSSADQIASQNKKRFDYLDHDIGGQSSRCTKWMSEVDLTLKQRLENFTLTLKATELESFTRLIEPTKALLDETIATSNALATEALLAAGSNTTRADKIAVEMQQHVDCVTRWRNVVDDGLNRRFDEFLQELKTNELGPLVTGLSTLSQKIDRCCEKQQHLITLIGAKISDLDNRMRSSAPEAGALKFQVKVSLQKAQAMEEDCPSPDSVLGVVSLNRTQIGMLQMDD